MGNFDETALVEKTCPVMAGRHAATNIFGLSMSAISATKPRWQRWLKQILVFVMIGFAITVAVKISTAAAKKAEPAGFWVGVLNGAVMPTALPHLALGHDVQIYAPENTGRTYKLGYTVGVNACGAVFFGFFFWRVNRWRKK